MEPKGSLPHSQQPATEPGQCSPCLKIHFNIILPYKPRSSEWPISLKFPHQNPAYTFLLPIHATCPAHFILLVSITRRVMGEEYRSLRSSLCSFLYSLVTSSLSAPNILLNTLFANTLSLRSSFKMGDQVSHHYKTTGKSTLLYILIFIFLCSKLSTIFCTE